MNHTGKKRACAAVRPKAFQGVSRLFKASSLGSTGGNGSTFRRAVCHRATRTWLGKNLCGAEARGVAAHMARHIQVSSHEDLKGNFSHYLYNLHPLIYIYLIYIDAFIYVL